MGSTEKEHNNKEYCEILAKTADYISDNYSKIMKSETVSAVGIGGGHYSYNFSKLVSEELSIGHICPDYRLKDLDKEMFIQMINKTVPKPSLVLIDKKVDKEVFISYCLELGISYRVV